MNQTCLDLATDLAFERPAALPPARRVPPSWTAAGQGMPACPITRRRLGGSGDDAPVLESIVPGSPAVLLCRLASQARAGCDFSAAMTQLRHLETGYSQQIGGLAQAAWRRWAVLLSFASVLSDVEVARLPLVLLPPAGVRPLHPLQRLQVLITEQLATPGWSSRLRALADGIAEARQREDFQLFVGALAPRLLELPDALGTLAGQRHALEDLWLDNTVRRRWQHVAVQLGAAGAETLLKHHPARRQATTLARGVIARAARSAPGGLDWTAGKPPKNSSATIGASA